MTQIWMVRHAPVDLPYIYGQMDVDANFDNASAFEFMESHLPKDATVYSSDLSRCLKTAERAGFTGVISSENLREQHFGEWQGMTYDEAIDHDDEFYWQFWDKPVETKLPGGESLQDVSERVWSFLRNILEEQPDHENIVLFSHAGVIRTILAGVLSVPLSASLKFKVDPLSVSQVSCYRTADQLEFDVGFVNRSDALT
ncbi:histidine phosphatase family protein [Sneathiella sp. P13V-1]|uniref:histidine phosphatase family protein n=1 Tax=Sneathiella sp. P13V-1 TaxID=2697366 RepID=UPI001D12B7CA|nr:histidine phosphatase family protein [Sneathiella sp. P13V-1]